MPASPYPLPSHPGNKQPGGGRFFFCLQACFSLSVSISAFIPKSCASNLLPPTHPAQPPHLKALFLTALPPAADPSVVPPLFHSRSSIPRLHSPERARSIEPALPAKEFQRGKEGAQGTHVTRGLCTQDALVQCGWGKNLNCSQ